MDKQITRLTLDVGLRDSYKVVFAKMGDTERRVIAEIKDNGEEYSLAGVNTVEVRCRKADGKQVTKNATKENNTVVIDISGQMTTCKGTAIVDVVLYGTDGGVLSTAKFYLNVDDGAVSEDDIKSNNEYKSLTDALRRVGLAKEVADTAINTASTAEEKVEKLLEKTVDFEKQGEQIVKNKEDIGSLKEDISDLTDTIISIDKSNVSENVDNYENIESTIIKSNGKLESNSYTARFVVKKYINLTKASYTVKGFCQGNQCLYVLCDKNGDVIKYEDSTSQGSSGIKAVDITIDEQDTILYVGGYETIIAVVKKYLYDVKLTTRLSNIYRKKVTLNGDSIAFGAGTGGTGFMDYIASKYNMTLDKKAVSGATIANLSSRYPNKHCISTSIDTMAEDANYIIFEGGYNDWLLWTQIGTLTDTMSGDLDDTKFYGALESICRQALAKWENGKIGFIITHKINDAWRTQKQEGATYPTLDGYYQAIKNVCEKYSIPYLDLSKVSRLNTELQNYKKYTYNSDGVHPTEDGYQIFYVDTITKWMENL